MTPQDTKALVKRLQELRAEFARLQAETQVNLCTAYIHSLTGQLS